jgi:CMP-N-acetylneuraminic acid synthetase
MRVLAIIPARGGSKRLPGKNIRRLRGLPLIQWTLDFATIEQFDTIEISTDDAAIAECCASLAYPVTRLRPARLATDEASTASVVLEMLEWKASRGEYFDLVALLQPTTPIRDREHWDRAFALISEGNCDAVVGFGPAASHPHLTFKRNENNTMIPFMAPPASLRAQDLEPAFVVNGSMYLIRTDVLKREETFFPSRTMAVEMLGAPENLDIDTEFDWLFAEWIIEHFYGRK